MSDVRDGPVTRTTRGEPSSMGLAAGRQPSRKVRVQVVAATGSTARVGGRSEAVSVPAGLHGSTTVPLSAIPAGAHTIPQAA